MTPENRAEDVFVRALEVEKEAREGWLSRECGDDAGLRCEVESLLRKSGEADSFFGDDKHATFTLRETEAGWSEAEGDRVGPFILRRPLGEGGFGMVWQAEQLSPISRLVALKVVKAGMDTGEILARFEAERQALALMDHPNIAKILEVGVTAGGRPYFAMELVKGVPITDYCRHHGATLRKRLELFQKVCSAVSHAHQRGVIHRDLKPSNVLVTMVEDDPVVKVIDFGIAKALHGKLSEATIFTRHEQFLGTPVYMSPEQAALSAVGVDTRSDVYSLGVLLYELLAGPPPLPR